MRINDIYSYDNSNISSDLSIENVGPGRTQLEVGKVIEGLVVSADKSTTVSFKQLNNREISMPTALKGAYVGEVRRFEVVETSDKLVLKDLGGIGSEIAARGVLASQVDLGLPQMAEDFADNPVNDGEDEGISRMSGEDYKDFTKEIFSIEDYKAERLVRALARIKSNRAAKRESIAEEAEDIRNERDAAAAQAAKSIAEKLGYDSANAMALLESDLPITEANLASIEAAVSMSTAIGGMSSASFAYLIKNELEPSLNNVYMASHSGSERIIPIAKGDWLGLEPAAQKVVDDVNDIIEKINNDLSESGRGAKQNAGENKGDKAANAIQPEAVKAPEGEKLAKASIEDAKWLLERDLPLTEENLCYKKELEALNRQMPRRNEVAYAAGRSMALGKKATDAVLTGEYRLHLQEIRLQMAGNAEGAGKIAGLKDAVAGIKDEVDQLRRELKDLYRALAEEVELPNEPEVRDRAIELAVETDEAVRTVANAPVGIYSATFTVRTEITLGRLAAAARYEESGTQIRTDLGDSINKAFGNIDSLLTELDLESTEANVRAVKILGHNSMEISPENIENIKFYDAKISRMVQGMKPAVVMSMIKRGFNPLENDLDSINREIRTIEEEEGVSDEEKFGRFLVHLDETNSISPETREAFVGIYRLLYKLGKSDGAAIGAAINSGRKLTLGNLLTEARTARGRGIDVNIDDEAQVEHRTYTNSITEQIEYNLALVRTAAAVTEPAVWERAAEQIVEQSGNERSGAEQTEARGFASDDAYALKDVSVERLVEHLEQAQETHEQTDPQAIFEHEAAALRAEVAAGALERAFLRSFGISDSIRNTRSLKDITEERKTAADRALGFTAKSDLLNILTDEDSLQDRFTAAAQEAGEAVEDELLNGTGLHIHTRNLQSMLDNFGLLRSLAQKQHFRMSVEGDSPALINLTVVKDAKRAGTVSLEITTDNYHVHAELGVEMTAEADSTASEETGTEKAGAAAARTAGEYSQTGRIYGFVGCDGAGELGIVNTLLATFKEASKRLGFDSDDIGVGIDAISTDKYMSRLGELKKRSESTAASTPELYRLARAFVEAFI